MGGRIVFVFGACGGGTILVCPNRLGSTVYFYRASLAELYTMTLSDQILCCCCYTSASSSAAATTTPVAFGVAAPSAVAVAATIGTNATVSDGATEDDATDGDDDDDLLVKLQIAYTITSLLRWNSTQNNDTQYILLLQLLLLLYMLLPSRLASYCYCYCYRY